jgi:hypothetical protein
MKQDDSIFRLGDIVIGSSDPGKSVYSATGNKINDEGVFVYGDASGLDERRKDLVTSAVRSGGKLLKTHNSERTTKKIKSKKKMTSDSAAQMNIDEYVRYIQENESPASRQKEQPIEKESVLVQFENDFGKIKVKIEHLVDHPQAFMLVFKDEDSVLFEPKVGESLSLHTSLGSFVVYYPGVTFDWPDSSKRIMILFKVFVVEE